MSLFSFLYTGYREPSRSIFVAISLIGNSGTKCYDAINAKVQSGALFGTLTF